MREAATVCPRPCKLTFDLLTLKLVSESRVTIATSVPILVFLALSVLELGQMYATDRQTSDVRRASSLNAPYPRGGGVIMDIKRETGWVSITRKAFPRISFPRKWRGRARLLDRDEAGEDEESTCDIAVRVWSRQWNELSAVNVQFMLTGCNWNWAVLACDGSPLSKKHMRKPWKTMNRYCIMLLR